MGRCLLFCSCLVLSRDFAAAAAAGSRAVPCSSCPSGVNRRPSFRGEAAAVSAELGKDVEVTTDRAAIVDAGVLSFERSARRCARKTSSLRNFENFGGSARGAIRGAALWATWATGARGARTCKPNSVRTSQGSQNAVDTPRPGVGNAIATVPPGFPCSVARQRTNLRPRH